MINKPIHLRCDRKSQCNSHASDNKSVNCVTLLATVFSSGAPFQWATVFFFFPPRLVFLLNAPAPWRNACPYIPSTAQSHWSLSQTIVKLQNRNEEKLVAYQDIPGTEGEVLNCDLALILSSFASKVLVYLATVAPCENITAAHQNTFSSSTFHLLH